MAREIATAFQLPLTIGRVRTRGGSSAVARSRRQAEPGDITITLENPDLCPYYAGGVLDVTVGPSPDWMQARLKAGGVRPISNIVDVTNYVLLELGQPMHAFDAATLAKNEIRVRTARDGERLKTLDGQERTLTSDMLVIADGVRPVGIAGVMGGADSEVTGSTRSIVLESAYFNPLSVRRTSRKLGLKTEASTRFERGTDRMLPGTALRRACALLEQIGAAKPRATVIAGSATDVALRVVRLRRQRVSALLGVTVPDDADRPHPRQPRVRRDRGAGRLVGDGAGTARRRRHARSTSSRRSHVITASTRFQGASLPCDSRPPRSTRGSPGRASSARS